MPPRPKPTALKVLAGNPGNRPLNMREPKPLKSLPRAPRWMTPEGKKVWRRLAPELFQLGVLTHLDGDMLGLLVQAVADYAEARAHLVAEGRVVLSPNNYPIMNPWEAMKNKALEQIQKLGAEFGLSPSARTKLVVDEPEDELSRLLFEDVSVGNYQD